jgi:hypothetical protein
MGTRSVTRVFDGSYGDTNAPVVLSMYRLHDGYPEKDGHGGDLANFLEDIRVVNGLSLSETGKVANGMGCLAAQMVKHFKNGPGGIYLTTSDDVQEFNYDVYENALVVNDGSDMLFLGTWKQFIVWVIDPVEQDGSYAKFINTSLSQPTKKYETVTDALDGGEIVNLSFTKKDGTTREMNCTTNLDLIPEDKHPTGTGAFSNRLPSNPSIKRVFDLSINEWRSFNVGTVTYWDVE